jgi:hypothetical protein
MPCPKWFSVPPRGTFKKYYVPYRSESVLLIILTIKRWMKQEGTLVSHLIGKGIGNDRNGWDAVRLKKCRQLQKVSAKWQAHRKSGPGGKETARRRASAVRRIVASSDSSVANRKFLRFSVVKNLDSATGKPGSS